MGPGHLQYEVFYFSLWSCTAECRSHLDVNTPQMGQELHYPLSQSACPFERGPLRSVYTAVSLEQHQQLSGVSVCSDCEL